MSEPDFDLAIVGGGIVGAMLAWRAVCRKPDWSVLWLERSAFGRGASACAGGLLTPFGRTSEHRALLKAGFELLRKLEEQTGPLPVRNLSGWYVASPHLIEERQHWFPATALARASAQQRDQLCQIVQRQQRGNRF